MTTTLEAPVSSRVTSPTLPATNHTPKPYTGPSADEVLALRKQFLNPGLFLYYKKPIMLVEGHMQYIWDDTGKRYLDGLGGIVTISVGHFHPHVVEAARRQNETLQHSTTIYLHPNIAEFAQKLASKMPGDLKVCYFVNSGSEANDLALLMARAYTGNYDVIALRNSYHGGNVSGMGMTAHSTWKFNVPHSFGVHHALVPDPYRGPHGRNDPEAGTKYAADVKQLIDFATPGQVAGFVAESIQGVGGVVVFPDGYLKHVYEHVRAAGGVCIADEVQVGFGRTGTHFWGFETQGVVPDIVTLGKPIGNGHPLAAVVTTPEIAASFNNGTEYFNTFGGNPVSCAIGMAVLDVIAEEQLQANALQVGTHLMDGLRKLMEKHSLIGDVRGSGLFVGIELVLDRETLAPAGAQAAYIANRLRERGILLSTDGPFHNVLKIKPPMVFTEENADFLVETLDEILGEDLASQKH